MDLSMPFVLSDFAAVNQSALCAARIAVGAAVSSNEPGMSLSSGGTALRP